MNKNCGTKKQDLRGNVTRFLVNSTISIFAKTSVVELSRRPLDEVEVSLYLSKTLHLQLHVRSLEKAYTYREEYDARLCHNTKMFFSSSKVSEDEKSCIDCTYLCFK